MIKRTGRRTTGKEKKIYSGTYRFVYTKKL